MTGQGVRGVIDGRTVLLGNARLLASAQVDMSSVDKDVEALRLQGQTVMYLAAGAKVAGYVGVADAIKTSTAVAIAMLKASGVRIVMLTAAAVGKRLGQRCHGAEFRFCDWQRLAFADGQSVSSL